jgi:hypothetical protein
VRFVAVDKRHLGHFKDASRHLNSEFPFVSRLNEPISRANVIMPIEPCPHIGNTSLVSIKRIEALQSARSGGVLPSSAFNTFVQDIFLQNLARLTPIFIGAAFHSSLADPLSYQMMVYSYPLFRS